MHIIRHFGFAAAKINFLMLNACDSDFFSTFAKVIGSLLFFRRASDEKGIRWKS
jgi:hypothetical protein